MNDATSFKLYFEDNKIWMDNFELSHLYQKKIQISIPAYSRVFLTGNESMLFYAVLINLIFRQDIHLILSSDDSIEKINLANPTLKITIKDEEAYFLEMTNNFNDDRISTISFFTSGSTGSPKLIVHDKKIFFDSINPSKIMLDGKLKAMLFFKATHIGGINTLIKAIKSHGKLTILSKKDPYLIAELIDNDIVNILPISSSMLSLLYNTNALLNINHSNLKYITVGSEPINSLIVNKMQSTFPNIKILQTYGLTETGIQDISNNTKMIDFFKFSNLRNFKIVDDILYLKWPNSLLKIIDKNETHLKQEWFCTEDKIEQRDSQIKIIGRINDQLSVGGLKFYPYIVENLISEHPNVILVKLKLEEIVEGINSPVAYIYLKDSLFFSQTVSELTQLCARKLERHTIPVDFREYTPDLNKEFKIFRSFS